MCLFYLFCVSRDVQNQGKHYNWFKKEQKCLSTKVCIFIPYTFCHALISPIKCNWSYPIHVNAEKLSCVWISRNCSILANFSVYKSGRAKGSLMKKLNFYFESVVTGTLVSPLLPQACSHRSLCRLRRLAEEFSPATWTRVSCVRQASTELRLPTWTRVRAVTKPRPLMATSGIPRNTRCRLNVRKLSIKFWNDFVCLQSAFYVFSGILPKLKVMCDVMTSEKLLQASSRWEKKETNFANNICTILNSLLFHT